MPTDLDTLQGTWYVSALETNGEKMPASAFSGSTIVIKKQRFKSVAMGATYEGTLTLDVSTTPKKFDLVFDKGHAAGTRNVGIYKLNKDRWTICLATQGSKRPATFATRPGTGLALETFQRDKVVHGKADGRVRRPLPVSDLATAASAEGTGVPTAIEGDWAMVSAVFSGSAMDAKMVKWAKRVTRRDVTVVTAGPQVFVKARFVLDTSKTPHAIDYINLPGAPNAGKPQAGIYEITHNTLKICMAAPGKPRPSEFTSTSGDGRSFTTWLKT
jgi:uncharacterized protein (TIGR03067 family)